MQDDQDPSVSAEQVKDALMTAERDSFESFYAFQNVITILRLFIGFVAVIGLLLVEFYMAALYVILGSFVLLMIAEFWLYRDRRARDLSLSNQRRLIASEKEKL